METVLVVGATGNIGVAAIKGVLLSGRNVLAAVRNQDSANKMFQHVGTKEGITTVQVDVTSETGIKDVVEQVEAGKLPAFQHVISAVGGLYAATPLQDVSTEELRKFMHVNFESNFWAYRATLPYLLGKKDSQSSWTLVSGAQGDLGMRATPSITQGALFSMANVAARDNLKTSVRFNELYIGIRAEVDQEAAKSGSMKASDLAHSFTTLLDSPQIRSSRVRVYGPGDLINLKHELKVKV